jgi:hypothetical protein
MMELLIVSIDYYEVLTKVIVKQIMIVDTYRTTRNDSWNIDCMILDDVSTFHTHQQELLKRRVSVLVPVVVAAVYRQNSECIAYCPHQYAYCV